jgi:hypothetical protein
LKEAKENVAKEKENKSNCERKVQKEKFNAYVGSEGCKCRCMKRGCMLERTASCRAS